MHLRQSQLFPSRAPLATLALLLAAPVQSETLTFTAPFGFPVSDEFSLARQVYVASETFTVQGFDPGWGSLQTLAPDVRASYQYSVTSNNRTVLGGDFYGTAGSLWFFSPSVTQTEETFVRQFNSISLRHQGIGQIGFSAPDQTRPVSGTVSPVVNAGTVTSDYISPGQVAIQTWAQLGAQYGGSAENGPGSVTGAFRVTYDFEPGAGYDPAHVVLSPGGDTLWDNALTRSPVDLVGGAGEVVGQPKVIRPDGTVEDIVPGTPIGFGDTVETGPGETVTLDFVDGTEFAISDEARLTVDEYVFDPSDDGTTDFSLLQGVYLLTRDILVDETPRPSCDEATSFQSCYVRNGIGFRGDAAEVIQRLDPEAAEQFDPAVLGTFASPVTLTAAVDVPTSPFDLSFDYAFLDGAGMLDVFLGGTSIFSSSSATGETGLFQTASVSITDQLLLSLGFDELSFRFEGETGDRFIVDNLAFPGFQNGGFDFRDQGWFVTGPGSVEMVGLYDESVLRNDLAPIPLPASGWALVSALFALGFARRIRSK